MFPLNVAAATVKTIINITNAGVDSIEDNNRPRAGWQLGADGIVYAEQGTNVAPTLTPIDVPDWIAPKVGMTSYEAFVTDIGLDAVNAGSDATGAWVSLGTVDRIWRRERLTGASGNDDATITVQIRNANSLVVLSTATISLVPEKTP